MGRTAQSVSRFFSLRKQKQKDWAFPEELCRRFTYAEISAATQCFDESLCIGKGGFGSVYKGRIKVDGDEDRIDVVAIKRFSKDSDRGMRALRAEVQLLCQLRHPNLISLTGFCQENGELIIVYDYMPNGSLFDHLIDTTSSINPLPLTWKQRLKICIGVARSLHYLHAGIKHTVIHQAVKCSNILLDQNLVPKLSGFGDFKMGPPVLSNALIRLNLQNALMRMRMRMNTNSFAHLDHLDPEYLFSGMISEKSDVFSFGVVLLEVLRAKSFVRFLNEEYSDRGEIFPEKIDPFLKGKVAPHCLIKFMNIAERCVRPTGAKRPTMGEVQVELECALELQESADAVKQLKELGTSASTSLAPPLPAHDTEDYTYENISFSEINETLCNGYPLYPSTSDDEAASVESIASLDSNREAIT